MGQLKLIALIVDILFGAYLLNMKYAWIVFPEAFKKASDPWIFVIAGSLLAVSGFIIYSQPSRVQKHIADR